MADIRTLLSAYSKLNWRDRLHVAIRWCICPLQTIAAYVPKHGVIIDLGCGQGLFAQLLAREAPGRTVIGIDLDVHKVGVAQQLLARQPNLQFSAGDVTALEIPPADAITILDVFYLIPYEAQEGLLAACAQKLRAGGAILLKDMAERPRWKVWLNWLEEMFAVRVFHITVGSKFYFRSCADWQGLFHKLGFAVQTIPLDRGYYHPHVLFIATKPA